MTSWDFVGNVAVDSGTLIVVDPCYVDDDAPSSIDDLTGPYDESDQWQPKALIAEKAGPGAQFVRLSAFGGDGVFPVYVQRDAGGMVLQARIDFR